MRRDPDEVASAEDTEGSAGHFRTPDTGSTDPSSHTSASTVEVTDIVDALFDANSPQNDANETAIETDEIERAIVDLFGAIMATAHEVDSSGIRTAATDEKVDSLQIDLEEVSEDLETVERDLTSLATKVRKLDRAANRRITTLTANLETAVSRIEEVENTLDAESTTDRLDTLTAQLETILGDLLEQAETATTVRADLRSDIDRLEARLDREEAVDRAVAIRAEANRLGISHARCANCDHSVDLRLLDRAVCPSCTTDLTSLDADRGWLRSRYLLRESPTN